ncbi:MAG: hypothetical protein M3R36_11690 [Bacteroidota bacterium]|nr:hypothetical protein [Bacteroidota bacterium]
MINFFKENIDGLNLRRTAEIACSIFVLAIASIIIFNTIKFSDATHLSFSNKALKHLVEDHKVNNTNFSFIKIDFTHNNYFEKKSDSLINVAAATGLFLVSYSIIFYACSGRKPFFAENFLFDTGFKNSLYRPPKYFS